MSDDNKPESVDPQPKPMKGKYDGRRFNGRKRTGNKPGPKPKWMNNISRNAAYKILKEFDTIVSPSEIYAWCWENKKVELMVGMREYVWNRFEGRPFIAENPAKAADSNPAASDQRLQTALKTLIQPTQKTVVEPKTEAKPETVN